MSSVLEFGKAFQQFCGRGGGEGLMGKWVAGFSETASINFTSRLLFDLLFICSLKDVVSLVIFHSRFLLLLFY